MNTFIIIQEVAPHVKSRFGVVQEVESIKVGRFDIIQGVGVYAIIKKLTVVQEVEQVASSTVITRTRN